MKKLQLFVVLFLVAGTTNVFASNNGKTVRNSAENPSAKKQNRKKIAAEKQANENHQPAEHVAAANILFAGNLSDKK